MKNLLIAVIFTCISAVCLANEDGEEPKWSFLGDDDGLRYYFGEAQQVILLCIVATDLEDIRPPFATVVHRATVVRSLKGDLKIGDKIEVTFATDSLPTNKEDREKFIMRAHESAQGDLRFAFLSEGEKPRFSTEFLFVPKYTSEMAVFLDSIKEPQKRENKSEMVAPKNLSD
ncbi:hypothetical protein [Luteolibacter sp. AS25]|uniref:hypothetical protein n=1 Tax=Luteolibacter sp. AS25 TaxID=3135776 RepID=UPI00398B90A5